MRIRITGRAFLAVAVTAFLAMHVIRQTAQGAEEKAVKTETVTVGGGCFWCIEAVFQQFKGISKVESGYAGGAVVDPSYDQVSSGRTGHAEVVNVTFDPSQISLEQLLTIFFHAHDPTTKDRQGNDVGPQYRSAIFYRDDEQKAVAERVKVAIEREKVWERPLVTEIAPLDKFYRAEDYHQNYYNQNQRQGYCLIVIAPKIEKVRKEFANLLK